ncbi:MAG: hypothetical protein DRR19_09035 [Candidatus Parabeggiatoa sp. nov. 1]|nr:MAG: hypothetical protein DRR19_09035 [Gammaproteobacteria bacterium]
MKQVHHIQYGETTIEYELYFAQRKTLVIEVHSDLKITVKAPIGTVLEYINAFVKKHTRWILKKQRAFKTCDPKQPPKQYVNGERHYYLGCQYCLKVIVGEKKSVTLKGDDLWVTVNNPQDTAIVKKQLDNWYRNQAKQVFTEQLTVCHRQVSYLGIDLPVLHIRKMKKRWGSCSQTGKILLNTSLIKAPITNIDYVITHELCHLKVFNHCRAFYDLLSLVMPDWETRKARLNRLNILDE